MVGAAGSSEFLEAVLLTCFFFVFGTVGEKPDKVEASVAGVEI